MDKWNWDLIVAVASSFAAITSAIIASVSLHFMIKINRTASEFAEKQANIEEKWRKKSILLMKYLLYYTLTKTLQSNSEIVEESQIKFASNEIVDEALENIFGSLINDDEND